MEAACSLTLVCGEPWEGGAHQGELQNIMKEVAFGCILKAGKNFHTGADPGKV